MIALPFSQSRGAKKPKGGVLTFLLCETQPAAGFIIMGVSTILLVMLSFKASPEKRQYFFTPCFITAIGCFSYYAMLSGQSWLITPNCRQMFYVRYLDWAVTMPLAALAIGMVSGADKATIAAVMGGCAMLVFSAFMAAITGGFIKWLWFVMHLAVLAALMAALLVSFKGSATRRHPSVPELVSKLSSLLIATWAIAPLVFVCAAGLGYWSPNFEVNVSLSPSLSLHTPLISSPFPPPLPLSSSLSHYLYLSPSLSLVSPIPFPNPGLFRHLFSQLLPAPTQPIPSHHTGHSSKPKRVQNDKN